MDDLTVCAPIGKVDETMPVVYIIIQPTAPVPQVNYVRVFFWASGVHSYSHFARPAVTPSVPQLRYMHKYIFWLRYTLYDQRRTVLTRVGYRVEGN